MNHASVCSPPSPGMKEMTASLTWVTSGSLQPEPGQHKIADLFICPI
jgi:hypothetical protein